MNRSMSILPIIIVIAAVFFLGGRVSFAQADAGNVREPSYEAMLYIVLGSADAATGTELPRSLSPVAKQLRDNFAFGNYRLLDTYVGRIANAGTLEYKSISSLSGPAPEPDTPSFLEWNISDFRSLDDSGGQLLVNRFRFGARVPLKLSAANPSISYESVGLSVNRLSLSKNSPTLIGTITLPRTTGTVFLVLNVRPV